MKLWPDRLQGRRSSFVRRVSEPVLGPAPALLHVVRSSRPRIEHRSDACRRLAAFLATRLLMVSLFHGRYQSRLGHKGELRHGGLTVTLPCRSMGKLLRTAGAAM